MQRSTIQPRGIRPLLGLPALAGLLLAGCSATPPRAASAETRVDVRGAKVLTPAADEDAPPLILPKPKRSPEAARREERS